MKKKILFMAIALVYSLGYSQGDTCAAAATVSCGTDEFDYVSYTTTGFTDTAGNSTNDVFFTITPASAETINVDTCFTPTTRDTKITVYSDCTLNTIIAQNDIGSCGYQARVSFSSDGVSSYIIMVEGGLETPSGADGALKNGDFEMVVWCSPLGSVPQLPEGITCNSSTSGPSLLFSDELDVQGSWTGDIATSQIGGNSNSGMWEILPEGSSSSTQTGPDESFSGISYMNFEATGTNNGTTASAVSGAVDLSGTIVEDAELTFYMHAYGSVMGTLEVGVGTFVSGPFTTEYTWSGEYQTIDTQDWFQVGVDLSGYLGQTIFIEFKQTSIGAFQGDMSIDLVQVNACDTVLDVENNENVIDGLTLYPNPVRDYLNLRSLDQIDQISIYNLLGQEVRYSSPSNTQTSIDMESLESGIYIVKIEVGNKTANYKIIKE
jgi:hypothetical protein